MLYNLGHMHPPQPDLPAIIARLQGRGVATIVLTSRGPEFRVATERELQTLRLRLRRHRAAVHDVPGGDYLAYDPANPEQDGLTADEIKTFKLAEPRPVSYANGIFMTAGQHKGIMLLTLLHHADRGHQGDRLRRRQRPPRRQRVLRGRRPQPGNHVVPLPARRRARPAIPIRRQEDVTRRWHQLQRHASSRVRMSRHLARPTA